MSDVPTATKIAALAADVVRLTAELQGEREDLAEARDYNQRLLSENVRLSNEAAFMRGFINNEDVRSDFQTVTQMRQALDRERERVREWNVLVAQGCTPSGSEFHDSPANVAMYLKNRDDSKDSIIKSKQKELNKERERCGVLEAELRGWRLNAAGLSNKEPWHIPHREMRITNFRHALDAAKFVGGGQ